MGHHFFGKRTDPDKIDFLVWFHSDKAVEDEVMAFLKDHSASGMFNKDCGWSTVFVHCDDAETVRDAIREQWGTAPGFRIEEEQPGTGR